MIYDFSLLRPVPSYPTYPPYHTGDYLEDYFFKYFLRNKEKFDAKQKILLPISWTTLMVENTKLPVNDYLGVLDPSDSYIAVSQHDDGIRWQLPPNTVHFGAGGLGGGIPIPLICSAIPTEAIAKSYNPSWGKDIFCSFIGSMTHPIRKQLFDTFNSNSNFVFNAPKAWEQSIKNQDFASFLQATQRSKFSLAPRGYGLSSFRLYEIMQLNSIPVYVSDKHWLPFSNELNWEEFCVIIKPEQISNLENILKNISDEQQQKMLQKGKEVWNSHFTLESMCDNILKCL